MKIENCLLQFDNSLNPDLIQLTPLQINYLSFLRSKKSIRELIEHYLRQGWLVNFAELYNLIETLSLKNLILNPEVKYYLKTALIEKSILKSQTPSQLFEPSQIEISKLEQLSFFRHLDPKLSAFLLKSGKQFKLKKNSIICRTNDSTRDLYVLLSGQAGIFKNISGAQQLIATLDPYAVFGESGFLMGNKRTADIITLANSEVFTIPYNEEVLSPYLNKKIASQLQLRFWVQHALIHSEIFCNFPSDCLDSLSFAGKIVELKKNTTLFTQGDRSEAAYVVIQGELLVQQKGKIISTLNQGSFCGEISLMATKGIRTATVISQKDSLLLEIHQTEFYKLLSQNLFLAKEIESLAKKRLENERKSI